MENTMKNQFGQKAVVKSVDDFNAVVLRLASPEKIREWSHGEVTKPETMNYRTQRSEKNGLFDERIFGPERDWECYCGKYKGIRYKGIICEKCGVELTRSIVRRERMGHIELAVPVAHIWFLRTMPSRIAQVLGINAGDVERVVYFAGYLITKVNEEEKARLLRDLDTEYKNKVKTTQDEKTREALTELVQGAKRDIESIQVGHVLDEVQYHKFSLKFGTAFEAGIGAEAVYNIFKQLDLKKLLTSLEAEIDKVGSTEREKLFKRISVIKAMVRANVRPEWMFMSVLPVIPAALRPMVALDGGRHATSDVNDLYRRVINRNNRLKKLLEIHAPDVILRNEKRILQEAIDALLDNSIRHSGAVYAGLGAAQRRPLKSLADNLKSKRGLFRQNLLGKRVDYSGRSVIVVGPDLKLNQCGLPKHMALELFRPFVIGGLLKKELAFNIRGASRLIDDGIPEVWAILEEVIKDKYVLLNRAPTLHRLSLQAFQPVLIEGSAIQIHPLVCSPFNADFDGDTMAVHVPLSAEAQKEASMIMASHRNLLKPGTGEPTVTKKMLDIVLGCYWMTKIAPEEKGAGKIFASTQEAITALNYDQISYRAPIKVLAPTDSKKYAEFAGKIMETTVGRIMFNALLPEEIAFMNKEITQGAMSAIVDEIIQKIGIEVMPEIVDSLKKFGFRYATESGTTWSLDDVTVSPQKHVIVDGAKNKAAQIREHYNEGLITDEERYRMTVDMWLKTIADVNKNVAVTLDPKSPVSDMVVSGARGSIGQLSQMVGMKGLVQNAQGSIIELPIISSFKEGLTPIEYFISTNGARKGMTDTALNTARAGYLTRRLFVVAQSVMVTEEDCGSKDGITVKRIGVLGIEASFAKTAAGRFAAKNIEIDGEVIVKKDQLISKQDGLLFDKHGIQEVTVRSPLTCKTDRGICRYCYGSDLGSGKMVELGEAVGTVAAQAIGEPGTQLTMRTFHTGGVATAGGDIAQGLPRVEELFDNRPPKYPAVIATHDGVITDVKDNGKEKIIKLLPDVPTKSKKGSEVEYSCHHARVIHVKVGQHVSKGQIITDGSANVNELYEFGGTQAAQEYIINEAKKLYELQGENVSRKHIEVIVREMFGRVSINEPGDSPFSTGDIVEKFEFDVINKELKKRNGTEAKGELVVMGILKASLNRKSFLASASFQHTHQMLIAAALKGNPDPLYGIMENVIIGRLIPAGTGFKGSPKFNMIEQLQNESNFKANAEEQPEA